MTPNVFGYGLWRLPAGRQGDPRPPELNKCYKLTVMRRSGGGAVRHPGSTRLPLKSCDSQPSSPPLAIQGVGAVLISYFINIREILNNIINVEFFFVTFTTSFIKLNHFIKPLIGHNFSRKH